MQKVLWDDHGRSRASRSARHEADNVPGHMRSCDEPRTSSPATSPANSPTRPGGVRHTTDGSRSRPAWRPPMLWPLSTGSAKLQARADSRPADLVHGEERTERRGALGVPKEE